MLASKASAALFALLPLLPLIQALTPGGRWGHQAVYSSTQQSLYIIGGQVQTPGTQITNDVLVLPLNGTGQWQSGPSVNLPPHAFASASNSLDGNSIMVVGGMTSDCSSDALAHSLDLSNPTSWVHANPSGFVRRRDTAMGLVNDGTTNGKLMVVGGISDQYCCGSTTNVYPAGDVLSIPLSASSLVSTRNLPSDLTGSTLAVSDSAMTPSSDHTKLYMIGGQDATGSLVGMDTIGIFSATSGWTSQKVTGSIPVPRVGAQLVAHPTLDVLILHGGARDNRGSDVSTTLVAMLNTTTWSWSIPQHLQPPQSSATSYHSATMIPSGVMITAFGLSSDDVPRSDVYYLDMRDPTGNTWTWKSVWNNEMLSPYSASTSSSGTNLIAPAPNNGGSGASSGSTNDESKKRITIAVPVTIFCVLVIPIIIFFIRRKIRINRKRRQARHFSFSSQEDEGDFHSSVTSPLNQFLNSRKKTNDQYPFGGRDANETDTTFLETLRNGVTGFMASLFTRSEMIEDEKSSGRRALGLGKSSKGKKGGKNNEKSMNWEEIDFGLGKIDSRRGSSTKSKDNQQQPSSRRSSFSATGSPPHPNMRYTDSIPMASGVSYNFNSNAGDLAAPLLVNIHGNGHGIGNDESPRMGTPISDGQQPLLIPSLIVLPPSISPASTSTLAPNPFDDQYSPSSPSPIDTTPRTPPKKSMELDWNMLENELNDKPAFRSISPTSPLRSHQTSHQSPSSNNLGRRGSSSSNPFADSSSITSRPTSPQTPITQSQRFPIPYVSRPESPSTTTPSSPSSTRTITLVNPKTGRRTSETLPLTVNTNVGVEGQRSVSSPIQSRQLAGSSFRRSSLGPSTGSGSVMGSILGSPLSPAPTSPTSTASGTPTIGVATRFDPLARVAGNPQLIITGPSQNQPGSLNGRRGSQLRVCNAAEEEEFRGQAF